MFLADREARERHESSSQSEVSDDYGATPFDDWVSDVGAISEAEYFIRDSSSDAGFTLGDESFSSGSSAHFNPYILPSSLKELFRKTRYL